MKLNRKSLLILIALGVVLIGIIALSIWSTFNQPQKENSLSINNFGAYVKNLPSSERDIIESTLYNTVSMNVADVNSLKSVKDVIIRNDSYTQSFSDNIYRTEFIVDIKSISQSYKIQDLFSRSSSDTSGLHDYTTLVLCLEPSKLLYGEFNCKDRLSQESGVSTSDPILQYLPVSTLDYDLKLDTSSGKVGVTAILQLSEVDYRLGIDSAIAQRKNDIKRWFISKDLDINKYPITYINN